MAPPSTVPPSGRLGAFLFFLLLFAVHLSHAQLPGTPQIPGTPLTPSNIPQRDTTNRTNSADWHDVPVTIHARTATRDSIPFPDSSIHAFHRRPFVQPWYRDIGNLGSPVRNLLFTPDGYGQTGPRLGYHVFDVYRLDADSLLYYNTTRPYSSFTYQLGSKLEQVAAILHTQNIRPNWNFSAQYTKLTDPGYFKIQRTNHDNGALNTWYVSPKQRYRLFAAFVYNREQQDENGGIIADTFLTSSRYGDRKTIPVFFQNDAYSSNRSSVTNDLRDYHLLLQHSYVFGRSDTTYNADSTQYFYKLVPRFSIAHRLSIGDERLRFKHQRADSLEYASFFARSFGTNDSIRMVQEQHWVENMVTLNSYFGKTGQGFVFSAGVGNRVDKLSTDYLSGKDTRTIVSNYLSGDLHNANEAALWQYSAAAKLFLTGDAAGNFFAEARAGRMLKSFGEVSLLFRQDLRQAGYNYQLYRNQFYAEAHDLQNESITQIAGRVTIARWGLNAGIRNFLLGNYTYLADSLGQVSNGRLEVMQAAAFSLTQLSLQKVLRFRNFVLDNELVYQQKTGDAPVNIPALMGRHQLSVESFIFHHALKVATGVEVRYHTPYYGAGYAPFYNRFYYQTAYELRNKPELTAFFNFKVKRFRAYFSFDQLQQLWWRNNIAAPGYPAQDFMLRFGFDWVLVN